MTKLSWLTAFILVTGAWAFITYRTVVEGHYWTAIVATMLYVAGAEVFRGGWSFFEKTKPEEIPLQEPATEEQMRTMQEIAQAQMQKLEDHIERMRTATVQAQMGKMMERLVEDSQGHECNYKGWLRFILDQLHHAHVGWPCMNESCPVRGVPVGRWCMTCLVRRALEGRGPGT